MSDTILGMLAFLVCLAIVVGVILWTSRRSQAMLRRWAEGNGYQIVASEHRLFRRDPFLWTTSRGQTVYYVTVTDATGQMRSGYIRCGNFWLGLWREQVEVRWDEAADPFRTG